MDTIWIGYIFVGCDLYFEPLRSLCVMDDLYTLKE